ncbi:MAG: hypothetical protein PVH11_07600 [Anaerolineae bacterium]
MLILDYDQSEETLTLDRLLRDWMQALRARWARHGVAAQRQPASSTPADREANASDHVASLIL